MGDSIEWEKTYSADGFSHKNKYPNEEIIRFVARNFFKVPFENRKEIKILDLGCGWGNNLRFLVDNGFSAYGVEQSETAVAHCKTFCENTITGDISSLSFEDSFFDAVIDRCAIQHNSLEEMKKISAEILRVLKPQGKFFGVMVSKLSSPFDFYTTYITEDQAREVYANFSNMSIDYVEQTFNNKSVNGKWLHIQGEKK